jgi:hypothetical protein
VIGVLLEVGNDPAGDASPSKVIAYYSDGGHRTRINVGWLLILLSVFFFLWFLGAMRHLVMRLSGDGVLSTVVTAGGVVYAATTLAASSTGAAIKTMSDDTYHHEVFPGLIHAANDTSYVLHSAGGAGIGAMIVAVSLAALSARSIPGWLGWLSFVAGIVAVFSIFFFPWFVIAIWLLVAGVLVTRALGRAHAAV